MDAINVKYRNVSGAFDKCIESAEKSGRLCIRG